MQKHNLPFKFSTYTAVSAIIATAFLTPSYAATANNKSHSTKEVSSKPAQNIGRYSPIFPSPSNVKSNSAIHFIARDPGLLQNLDYSKEAASKRKDEIRKLTSEFKLKPQKSTEALQIGGNLVRLMEEQCLYIENIAATGINESGLPDVDLEHYIKVARSTLINQIDLLLSQFPTSPFVAKWKATSLISRIKIEDPSVTKDALAYIKANKSGESTRIILTGIAKTTLNKKAESYGNLMDALKLPMDNISKSFFMLLLADSTQNAQKAIDIYSQAAELSTSTQGASGKINAILERSSARMVELAYQINPAIVNKDVIAVLKKTNMLQVANYYIERIALHSLNSSHTKTIALYNDIENLGGISPQKLLILQFRVLDIMLKNRDIINIETQWQKIAKTPDALKVKDLITIVLSTQKTLLDNAEKSIKADNIDRFIRMHDFFSEKVSEYKQNNDWNLKTLELLWKASRAKDVATRADSLYSSTQNGEVKVAALRYAARAREKLIGIDSKPEYKHDKKLLGDALNISDYLTTIDKLAPLVKAPESENLLFQKSYLLHLTKKYEEANKSFEENITKYAKGENAPKAISYLLEISIKNKNYEATEKTARLAEQYKINPFSAQHKNLRAIIEVAVYEQAQNLAEKKQYEPAAAKYLAFQKEFPVSKNAPTSLDSAAKNLVNAKQIPAAISAMELLLEKYPTCQYAKETRWQAAEQSKNIGKFLPAANHYEAYAIKYPADEAKRQAWWKAGDMHKALGRYSNTIADYEQYYLKAPNNAEKLRSAKEIADIQFKFGKSEDAVKCYERVATLATNTDDEIFALNSIVDIYLRQSKEANARKVIYRIIEIKPDSQQGFKITAKVKYNLGVMDIKEIRELKPAVEKNILESINNIIAKYEKVKTKLMAPCEVPGLEWCSVGYYEMAKLGEVIAKNILEVDPPPTLNLNETEQIKKLVAKESERLANESDNYAEQAENALNSGAPDADTAERIRAFAQSHRGEQEKNTTPK